MRMFLLVIILFSLNSLASDNINCRMQTKANQPYLDCSKQIYGYIQSSETIQSLLIKYVDQTGKKATIRIEKNISISDSQDSSKINFLLNNNGITNFTKASVESVSLKKSIPLYKDPAFYVLRSGCHMQNAPVVVSLPNSDKCDDYMCVGTVICKLDGKKDSKDAACKAQVQKTGVTCPGANDCLEDHSITVEKYVPSPGNPSHKRTNNSGVNQN